LNEDLAENGGFPYKRRNFTELLMNMGFRYRKIDKRIGKLTAPQLQDACARYLHKIKKFREENRYIVYLDETW